MDQRPLDYKTAHELFRYDRETGKVYRRIQRGNRPAGSEAGKLSKGYRLICVNDRYYSAHRIAWLMTYGAWPDRELDHINRRRDDNRIENLRPCTKSQNQANKAKKSGCLSRFKGVTFNRSIGKWQAQIRRNGKPTYLGVFKNEEDAASAYRKVALEVFGEFAEGEGV